MEEGRPARTPILKYQRCASQRKKKFHRRKASCRAGRIRELGPTQADCNRLAAMGAERAPRARHSTSGGGWKQSWGYNWMYRAIHTNASATTPNPCGECKLAVARNWRRLRQHAQAQGDSELQSTKTCPIRECVLQFENGSAPNKNPNRLHMPPVHPVNPKWRATSIQTGPNDNLFRIDEACVELERKEQSPNIKKKTHRHGAPRSYAHIVPRPSTRLPPTP